MTIKKLDFEFSIVKLNDLNGVDINKEFTFVAKTDEEISVVCRTEDVPANAINEEDGYKAFRIVGELDFSLVGILAKISGVFAENSIPVFCISTYNTDYVLVKTEYFDRALNVLMNIGYTIE